MPTRQSAHLVLGLALVCAHLCAVDWRPIDPEQLSLKRSKSDPNADAEALFREVRVLNADEQNVRKEYIRLKIFTQRGKEQYSDVQIPYISSNISGLEGRTIHPDGSVVALKKDSIFDKVIEKAQGLKIKVKSFAMPAVEPGSIIEYRFNRDFGEWISQYLLLDVQSDFPVDEVTFFIKPLPTRYSSDPRMRFLPFGCVPERGGFDREGYNILKVKNVPAFHEEPQMPPEQSARQWVLVYYEENNHSSADEFWHVLGRNLYKEYSEKIKVNGGTKVLANQITGGAKTDHDKLVMIVNYCRTQLKNVSGDNVTAAELDKTKTNKTTIDTLRRKEGTRRDIHFAFAALAQASGLRARVADLSDRGTFFFKPAYQSTYFLNAFDVAVQVNGKWEFYDVTNPSLAPGQLRWQEQGVYALINDSDEPQFVETPTLTSEETRVTRMANISLSPQGALEGDIREMYLGNKAIDWRQLNRHSSDGELENALRGQIKHRFPDFELTNVKYTASADLSNPITLTYHILVRNYAQRTGRRIFVVPDYFTAGKESRFPQTERYNSIYFEYPWSEADVVQLKLPEGFVLDHGDAPNGIGFAPVGSYSVSIGFDKTKNRIVYERQFSFGKEAALLFPVQLYPKIKMIFDQIHDADNHFLTLKADVPAGQAESVDK